jgi:hypothetical protein
MPMHNFSLVGEVFLYFIFASRSHWNSNLNWIQISLQIIKRFGKKEIFNFILAVGRNSVGSRARPGQPSQSSPIHPRSQPSPTCPFDQPCAAQRRPSKPAPWPSSDARVSLASPTRAALEPSLQRTRNRPSSSPFQIHYDPTWFASNWR